MVIKGSINMSIDSEVLREFRKLCIDNEVFVSAKVEEFMRKSIKSVLKKKGEINGRRKTESAESVQEKGNAADNDKHSEWMDIL